MQMLHHSYYDIHQPKLNSHIFPCGEIQKLKLCQNHTNLLMGKDVEAKLVTEASVFLVFAAIC